VTETFDSTVSSTSEASASHASGTGPIIARTRAELKAARAELGGGDVGVVMTMGALHEGHATLIRRARAREQHVIVTIFLNPLQFGPREDLSRYPRMVDADLEICRREGVDVVFLPTPDVIYPDGEPGVRVSAGPLGNVLEGQARPGHFDGVLTVVGKLLHLTGANRSYYGQKDAQQLLLIRRMARGLDFPVEVVTAPTVREADGLAMSSRNMYLTESDRDTALCLSRALRAGAAAAAEGPSAVRRAGARRRRQGATGPHRLPGACPPVDAGGRAGVVPRRGPPGRSGAGGDNPADRQHPDQRGARRRRARGLLGERRPRPTTGEPCQHRGPVIG